MATKRKLIQRTDSEWYQEIKECLTSGGGNFKWGSLSKEGYLFKIATLIRVKVPSDIMENLINTGTVALKSNGTHYLYVAPRARRPLNSN